MNLKKRGKKAASFCVCWGREHSDFTWEASKVTNQCQSVKVQVNEDKTPGICITILFSTVPSKAPMQSWHRPDPCVEPIVLRGHGRACAVSLVHKDAGSQAAQTQAPSMSTCAQTARIISQIQTHGLTELGTVGALHEYLFNWLTNDKGKWQNPKSEHNTVRF